MSNTSQEEGTDFNVVGVDIMDLVMSDLVILNKKERAPPKYIAIEPPINEGGKFSFSKRYLAYSREIPNSRFGRVALTDIKVLSASDRAPVGYRPLSETLDDNIKPFAAKVVAIKLTPLEEAVEAITDVLVLAGSKKEHAPNGYKRLPEINGFSICYQVTKLDKKSSNTGADKTAQPTQPQQPVRQRGESNPIYEPTLGRQFSKRKIRTAVDGLTFKLSESPDTYQVQFQLPDMNLLSLDDVENKFKFDWSLEEQIAQA